MRYDAAHVARLGFTRGTLDPYHSPVVRIPSLSSPYYLHANSLSISQRSPATTAVFTERFW